MKARCCWLAPIVCVFSLWTGGFLCSAGYSGDKGAAAAEGKPAEEFKKIPPRLELKEGDTFVFLGDSITHQCLYTQYVETYFYTRYPDRRILFRNAGVGGDRASHVIQRFGEDVAKFKPRYVSVLLGMNDGSYQPFEQEHFDTYREDMETILSLIDGVGAKAILMHPTMFDARASRLKHRNWEPAATYYNGVIALYGAWASEISDERGLSFVDMYNPMNRLTMEGRREDPAFTMIPDSVHPSPTGQVVMAVAMLEDLFVHSLVSSITIDPQAGGGRVVAAVNGEVTDVVDEGLDGKIEFNFLATALPWALPPEAEEGYRMTKAGHRHSMERFAARGLKPGRYALRIDGQLVGEYTNAQLAGGIELQENKKTPQYQQALEVALLNQKRNLEAVKALREWWLDLKRQDRDLGRIIEASGADSEKAKTKAAEKAEFEKVAFPQGVAKTTAAAKMLEDQIFSLNQPIKHSYAVLPVKE